MEVDSLRNDLFSIRKCIVDMVVASEVTRTRQHVIIARVSSYEFYDTPLSIYMTERSSCGLSAFIKITV